MLSSTQLRPSKPKRPMMGGALSTYVPRRSANASLLETWSLTILLPTRTEPNSQLIFWRISALVWAGLIFYLSTAAFGDGTSQGLLTRALAFVHLTLSPAAFDTVHNVCRKFAHLTEYGVFCLLLHRSLPTPGVLGGERQKVLWCVLVAAAYSLTDEFHQLFVPGRHGSFADCAIDSTGAALAMLLMLGYRSYRKKEAEGLE